MTSRQREWQKKRIEAGLCQYCDDTAVVRGYCQYHYELKQERHRIWRLNRKKKDKKKGQ